MDGKHDDDKKPKTYKFFVGSEKYETTERELTGAQIKAYVPDVPSGTKLSLEGHGHDPDRIIADDDIQHAGKVAQTLTSAPRPSRP